MPKIRKVLMLVENREVPVDARVWPEAMALRDAGLQVTVISPKGGTEHREPHLCIDGINVYRYDLPMGHSAATYAVEYGVALVMTFWLSLRVWWRHGFDAIHAANPPDIFFVLGLFYRLLGKAYVFDQHDLSPELFRVLFADRGGGPTTRLIEQLLLLFERWSYRTAKMVIVANASFRRLAIARGHCSPEKIVVVRNAPDLRSMQPGQPEPELKLGRRFLLAYMGVMNAQDGVDYTLRALDLLVNERRRQDVALVLIGDGPSAPRLREIARDLALDEYVHFTGWVGRQEILRHLTAADVGLSPDPYNELNDASTMIKTMEYMSMGKPVVAFDLTETRFSAQDAALYARPNLVEEFA
ncbi:MAG TPA: glycosyltransferase family 4 protein, partial [Ktedonobacterales bacterium]|nr:glycosyltransferase family 4 protein [Ktedonobacterales bacterium]